MVHKYVNIFLCEFIYKNINIFYLIFFLYFHIERIIDLI